jgi:NAD(P)H dehydrogenase (quinone)
VLLAVTGATGALGGVVARLLAGLHPRLVVRSAARAPALPGCEVAEASYGDRAAAVAALTGVDLLFMVSASETSRRRRDHRTFAAAAAEAGVRHVVYTSFLGAAPDATFTLARDHHDMERAIRASGMSWTFLRDGFYADVLPHFADRTGTIRGPAGGGRVSLVARRDVAECAAAVLRSPADHAGATYDLTGPEALTLTEAAHRMGTALGRDLRYEEETLEQAYASRRDVYDAEQWQLDAWVSTYTAIADGSVATVTNDVRLLTGHAPRTLDALLGR